DPTVNLITADGPLNSKGNAIAGNIITNPTFDDGNAGGGWGILMGFGDADGNFILANDISLNPDLSKNQFTFGVWFQGGGSDDNVIGFNKIHDVGFGAIIDTGDSGYNVIFNTFMHNAYAGLTDFGSTGGTTVQSNVFENNGRAGLEVRNGATGASADHNCFKGNG